MLCYAKPVYIQFYGMLADIGVDRKLVVMRELLKGDLLNMQIADEDLRGLAAASVPETAECGGDRKSWAILPACPPLTLCASCWSMTRSSY